MTQTIVIGARPGPEDAGTFPQSTREASARPLGAAELPDWDILLDSSSQSNPFLRSAFVTSLCEAQGICPVFWGSFEGGRLVAGLVGGERIEGNRPVLTQIALAPYNGVCVASDGPPLPHRARRRAHRALKRLGDALRARYARAAFDTHPAEIDLRPLTWNGWRTELRYTFTTDLSRLDESAFDPDVRRRARKAEASGLRFAYDLGGGEFERLWSISHARQGADTHLPAGALPRLMEALSGVCTLRVFGVRLDDGRPAAAAVVIFDRRTAYYWLAGFDPELAATGANQLCLIRTLREAAGVADRFDWLGANTPGVAEYKEAFNPTLVPYVRLQSNSAFAGVRLGEPRLRNRLMSWLGLGGRGRVRAP